MSPLRPLYLSLALGLLILGDPMLGQTQIKRGDLGVEAGDRYILHRTAYAAPGEDGQHVIWDFSSLELNSSNAIRVLDPSDSPFAALFPEADICLDYGHNDLIYSHRQGTTLTLLGGVVDGTQVVYSDGQDLFRYPMTYGDEYSDTFQASFELGDTPMERTGNIEVQVVGEGTVIIADHIFSDVLKVKVIETIHDRYEVATFPQDLLTVNESYYFIKAGLDDALVSLHVQSSEGSDEVRYGILLEYDPSATEARLDPPIHKVSISPNPLSSQGDLRFQSDVTAEMRLFVLDIQGKEISELKRVKVSPGPVEVSLSFPDLAPGAYLLRLDLEGRSRLAKFAKN